MQLLPLLALASVLAVSGSEEADVDNDFGHDHGHLLEPCGCAALESLHPFDIGCGGAHEAKVDAAILKLQSCEKSTEACSAMVTDPDTGESEQPCQMAFFTLQAHHDFCLDGQVDVQVDLLVHEYEEFCHSCVIHRNYDAAITSTCPDVDCEDPDPAYLAFHALNETCTEDPSACCNDNIEQGAYELLLSYHDQCDEAVIPFYMERAVHTWESWCIDARCNRVGPDYNGLACPSPPPQSPEPPPPPVPKPPEPSPPPVGGTGEEEEEEEEEPPPPPHVDEDDEHHHDHEEEEEEPPPPPPPPPPHDGDDGDDGEHHNTGGDGLPSPGADGSVMTYEDLDSYFNKVPWWIEGLGVAAGWILFMVFVIFFMFVWLVIQVRTMRRMLTRRSGMPIYSRFESKDGRTDNGGIDMGQMNGASRSAAHGDVA